LKNLLTLFVISFVFPNLGVAQDVEYYKEVAASTQNTALKFTALDSVISKTFRVDDDAFVDYSIQYINLAKDVDSIENAARKAMNLQFIITSRKNKPEQAVAIINGVLAHKYKIKDSFLLGGLYLKRGRANFLDRS